MSNNPYQSPSGDIPSDHHIRNRVSGPATCLIVVTIISLVLMVMSVLFSIFLLTSGVAEQMQQPGGMSKNEQLIVRLMLATLLIAVNGIILYGALQMKNMQSLGTAKTACILSLIPCCGPCYIVGIPFGIWGLIVLSDPEVQRAFR